MAKSKTAIVDSECGFSNEAQARSSNPSHEVPRGNSPCAARLGFKVTHLLRRSGARTIALDVGRRITIGRLPSNDIAIPVPSVSRLHAEILWEGERAVLRDRSSSGTLVNGCPITSHALRHGDHLEIGPFQCTYATRERPKKTFNPDLLRFRDRQ